MKEYMNGDGGLKKFAKELVSQYSLTGATRFSVVSFAETAKTRVPWSITNVEINTGIDAMKAHGPTSISGGFEAAENLLANARSGATKIVLFLSDGEQSEEFAAPGKTPRQTAIDAATRVKDQGATVFAWGFGNKVNETTLMKIASDESKAHLEQNLTKLTSYLNTLPEVCAEPQSNQSPTETETETETVVLMLTVSGSVSDFSDDDKFGLQQSVADAAGVDESLVKISVAAASVLITATIVVPASTTVQKVEESLSFKLGTAEAASTLLGITVEEDPVMSPQEAVPTLADQSTPAAEHVAMTRVIGGAAAAVALLALLLLAFASR